MNKKITISALAIASLWFYNTTSATVISVVNGGIVTSAAATTADGDMGYHGGGLIESAALDTSGVAKTSGSVSLDGVAQGQGGIAGLAGVSSGAFASHSAVAVTATSQVGVSVQSVSSGSMSVSTSSVSGGSSSASTQGTRPPRPTSKVLMSRTVSSWASRAESGPLSCTWRSQATSQICTALRRCQ